MFGQRAGPWLWPGRGLPSAAPTTFSFFIVIPGRGARRELSEEELEDLEGGGSSYGVLDQGFEGGNVGSMLAGLAIKRRRGSIIRTWSSSHRITYLSCKN